MITVKEAKIMTHTNTSEEIFSYNSFKRKLEIIRSLEKYSSKLDTLIEKTTNIENIFLKVGK